MKLLLFYTLLTIIVAAPQGLNEKSGGTNADNTSEKPLNNATAKIQEFENSTTVVTTSSPVKSENQNKLPTSSESPKNVSSNLQNLQQIQAAEDFNKLTKSLPITLKVLPEYFNNKSIYRIFDKVENFSTDGHYFNYQTRNGIILEEEGHFVNKGTKDEKYSVHGFYSFPVSNGEIFNVEFTSDGINGFIAVFNRFPVVAETEEVEGNN